MEQHEPETYDLDNTEIVDEQREYRKFALLFFAVVIVSTLLNLGGLTVEGWMQTFMGIVFLIFGASKVWDLENVAQGVREYDPIAQKYHYYGWAYPFIELFLGVSYTMGLWPVGRNVIALIFTGIGLYGLTKILGSDRQIQCVCLGKFIQLPLSKLTFFEFATMFVMALLMLILRAFS